MSGTHRSPLFSASAPSLRPSMPLRERLLPALNGVYILPPPADYQRGLWLHKAGSQFSSPMFQGLYYGIGDNLRSMGLKRHKYKVKVAPSASPREARICNTGGRNPIGKEASHEYRNAKTYRCI